MAANEVAVSKRVAIKAARKQIFLIVCLASILFGFTIVGVIYMTKTIIFNAKVLGVKDETIATYKSNTQTIRSLNNKVMALSDNMSLETVAQDRDKSCIGLDGKLIDFQNDVEATRRCSALRVIPDAMPFRPNATALGASLDELIKYPGATKESDSVGNNTAGANVGYANGVNAIDANFSVLGNASSIKGLLEQIERSIRPIDAVTANLEWRGGGVVSLAVQSNAYFVNEAKAQKKYKDVKMENSK